MAEAEAEIALETVGVVELEAQIGEEEGIPVLPEGGKQADVAERSALAPAALEVDMRAPFRGVCARNVGIGDADIDRNASGAEKGRAISPTHSAPAVPRSRDGCNLQCAGCEWWYQSTNIGSSSETIKAEEYSIEEEERHRAEVLKAVFLRDAPQSRLHST